MYIQELISQVEAWNENNKCGFSWEFSAPLYRNKINTLQPDNVEAVQVCLIWEGQLLSENNTNTNSYGISQQSQQVDNFELYFLLVSHLDINNYNEIKGHDTEEGRLIVLQRLLDCLKDNTLFDACDHIVTRWTIYAIGENIHDNNYIGFRVSVSLQSVDK